MIHVRFDNTSFSDVLALMGIPLTIIAFIQLSSFSDVSLKKSHEFMLFWEAERLRTVHVAECRVVHSQVLAYN